MADPEHKGGQHHVHESSDDGHSHSVDHSMYEQHVGHPMSEHAGHAMHDTSGDQTSHSLERGHSHQADHTGHEQMFRSRFWGSLLLSVPVLLFSSMLQQWPGFRIPSLIGDFRGTPL